MRIGIDLGGTKIEVVVLDDAGQQRLRRRVPSPRDYAGTLAAIAGLVEGAEAECGACSVGIGIPGSLSPATGLVRGGQFHLAQRRPVGG